MTISSISDLLLFLQTSPEAPTISPELFNLLIKLKESS